VGKKSLKKWYCPLGGQGSQGCRKRSYKRFIGIFPLKNTFTTMSTVTQMAEVYGDSYVVTSQNTTLVMPLWKHCTVPK